MKNTNVHYCPGSAVGSPAWLSPAEATRQLNADTRYLQVLEGVGAMELPVQYPHIGGSCALCQPTGE